MLPPKQERILAQASRVEVFLDHLLDQRVHQLHPLCSRMLSGTYYNIHNILIVVIAVYMLHSSTRQTDHSLSSPPVSIFWISQINF